MGRLPDSQSTEARPFFEGFAWPVPRAFAAAIAQPRFEQGDVLYSDPRGYAALEGKMPEGLHAIQILHPPRSVRAASIEGEGDRRRSAWSSEVTIEWVDLASGTSQRRELTQGRLFTALWRGDESWLDPEQPEPAPPRTARELHQALESVVAAFEARAFPGPGRRGCRFLFVVDQASDASRLKATAIEGALHGLAELEILDLAPVESGVEAGEAYHPALLVRGVFAPGRDEVEVRSALRAVLYAGGSPSEAPGEGVEGASDRFSLARHGLLESL